MSNYKVIAFDCFGTVFDLTGVTREDIDYYREVLDDYMDNGKWNPLEFGEKWYNFPAHPDSAAGINALRMKFDVVTMTNGPVKLISDLSKKAGISWDMIIPLEERQVYKTDPEAYMMICDLMKCQPEEVMMVTANPKFGDLEAADKLGMTPMVIRQPWMIEKEGKDPIVFNIKNIAELALTLGC